MEAKLGPKSGSIGPFFRLGTQLGMEATKKLISKPISKASGWLESNKTLVKHECLA